VACVELVVDSFVEPGPEGVAAADKTLVVELAVGSLQASVGSALGWVVAENCPLDTVVAVAVVGETVVSFVVVVAQGIVVGEAAVGRTVAVVLSAGEADRQKDFLPGRHLQP